MTFLEAIAKQEGYYVVGSRPYRNNNPGDLIYCTESVKFGAIATDGRFAKFSSLTMGWIALQKWLSVPARISTDGVLVGGYLGARIEQVIERFAPASDHNNTEAYILSVCRNTELKRTDVLTTEILSLSRE